MKSESIIDCSIIILFLLSSVIGSSQSNPSYYSNTRLTPKITPVLNLPTFTQTIQWISQNNSEQLQNIRSSLSFPIYEKQCGQISRFFDRLIGLMKMEAWKLNIEISQVLRLGYQLKKELDQIGQNIDRLIQKRQQIGLPRMKLGIESLLESLSQNYKNIAAASASIITNQQLIKENADKIEQLKQSNTKKSQEIFNKRLSLELYNKEIFKLEEQLNQLKGKRNITISQITEIENQIENNQSAIVELETKNNELYSAIEQLSNLKQNLNKQTLIAQGQIVRLQERMQNNQEIYKQILQNLQVEYRNKQAIQRQINSLESFSDLSNQTIIMAELIDQYEIINTKVYYSCYTRNYLSVLQKKSYILSNYELSPYLQRLYSSQVVLPQYNVRENYSLAIIDLFGYIWTRNFGFPFDEKDIIGDSLFLNGDKTCLQTKQRYAAGNGIIIYISGDIIRIQTLNRVQIVLTLGACTRLQSKNQIPLPNDTIYYKGIWVSPSTISVILVTVI